MLRFPRRGSPESFGWLRLPAMDRPGLSAWEMPSGTEILLPVGTCRLSQLLPSLAAVPDLAAARR